MSKRPGGIFDPEGVKKRIDELEARTGDPGFWDKREQAEKVMLEVKRLRNRLEPWQKLRQEVIDLGDFHELVKEEKAEDQEADVRVQLDGLTKQYDKLHIIELLSDKNDEASSFLTIHSGAGGTESCDWASMLYRMYTRWVERHGWKYEIIDYQEAEGGIKSATIEVTGDYAYGYLKNENGIHRLVRISPFDAAARRHTSFASVHAMPILDDDIDIVIRPEDVRIDTYRAGGAGGQHVNKTDSAVRITHLATGIVVQCQNERSQFKNKDSAFKVLRARLFEHYKAEQDKEMDKIAGEKKDVSWGNQIRSYVFQPYTMVKDTRTKYSRGDIQNVMDGDIDSFIENFMLECWLAKHNPSKSKLGKGGGADDDDI
jgi:peptide chain release factor 2